MLGTCPIAPAGTVTGYSIPVLPQAGESIFLPLGQPELPFAGAEGRLLCACERHL